MKKIIGMISEIETLSYFTKQLLAYLKKEGHSTYLISMERMKNAPVLAEEKQALWDFMKEDKTVLITFNFIGLSDEPCFLYDKNHTIWEEKKVEIYNILVDHPLYYATQLDQQKLPYHLFCLDLYHVEFVKKFYPKLSVSFMPLAGNEFLLDEKEPKCKERKGKEAQQNNPLIPYEERSYPLTFIGNYPNLKPLEEILQSQPKEYQDFYQAIFNEGTKKHAKSIELILEEALKRELVTSKEELIKGMQAIIFLDIYMRAFDRKRVVSHLLEENMALFLVGKDWDVLLDERKRKGHGTNTNVKISEGMLTSRDCIKILADTQISLNIMPGFKAGTHDRIYTSMLQQCVVLTDESEYLCDNFVHEDTLCFYDVMDLSTLSSQVTALMHSQVKAKEIARRGFLYAQKNQTWANRAKFLSDFFS